jgi:hypothetical protein
VDLHRIGRYRITGVLGRGAAGVVYHAHDPVIDRTIALKAVPTDDADPDAVEFRARFLREARAAGRLSHPGIVTVYDVGEDADHRLLYLTMEFVEGCSLKDVTSAGLRLDDRQIAALGQRVAVALDVAHRNGVVHRDVKPANVLLSKSGEVKLVDFGVARLDTSDLTKDGSSVGTPFYMSPEQILGRTVDGRSDLYSLGVILYELLSGRRPFTATGIGDLAAQIAEEPPPRLGELRPDLEGTLAPVVHRLLEKRPDDRYPSGREAADALRDFDGGVDDRAIRSAVTRTVRRTAVSDNEQGDERMVGGDDPLDTRAVGADLLAGVEGAPRRRRVRVLLAAFAALAGVLVVTGWLGRWNGEAAPPTTDDTVEMHEDVRRLRRAADLLEAGDADGALRIAQDVLDRRPRSDAAGRLVDAAAGARISAVPVATSTVTPTPQPRRSSKAAAAPPPTPTVTMPPTAAPTPLPSVLEVVFQPPMSEGSLVVEIDFQRLDEFRWDFSDTDRVQGGGADRVVTGEVRIPNGSHKLEVQLHAGRRGQIGMAVFDREFEPGSRWRILVELTGRRHKPSFRLERVAADD